MASITPEATISVPKVGWLAYDGTMLWVFTHSGQIARLDPTTNSIGALTTVDATHQDGGFAVSKRGLWISDFDANLVYRVDPTSLKVVAKIAVEDNPVGMSVGDDAVWVANHRGGSVTRIDPATNKVVAKIMVSNRGHGGPHQIGLGLGSVWVSAGGGESRGGTDVRIDPATNKIQATIQIPLKANACGGFAISQQAVWTASCGDQPTLVRIDPATNKVVATVDLGGLGSEALIDGHPWLSLDNVKDGGPGRLVRIDPESNAIDRSVSPGDTFKGGSLLVAAGSAWVTDGRNNQVIRLSMAALNR
jgi:virginiamycin B lyase